MTEHEIIPFISDTRPIHKRPLIFGNPPFSTEYFVLLSYTTRLRLEVDGELLRRVEKVSVNEWMHYSDAYLVVGSIYKPYILDSGQGIIDPVLRDEMAKLRMLLDNGCLEAAGHPPDLRKWSILRALKLSFCKIKVRDGMQDLEGCIVGWHDMPSTLSFPIECIFRHAASMKQFTLSLEEEDIVNIDFSQGAVLFMKRPGTVST